jgi:copper chaperone NosL
MRYIDANRRWLLIAAALLAGLAMLLPLWGMTLVSTQYPEGLRMVVYPNHIRGDIDELNALNHYIGMTRISDGFFPELRLLPLGFGLVAATCLFAAFVRRIWADLLPLALMAAVGGYGLWSMTHRLYQFGHDLDPTAAIRIAPFTPPMLGQNQIAQFATYAYFSWGTFLPLVAGGLVTLALIADLGAGQRPAPRAALAPSPAPSGVAA